MMYFSPNHICYNLKTSRRDTSLEKMHVAIHEGAHAVVAMAVKCRVKEAKIFLADTGDWNGHVRHSPLAGGEFVKQAAEAAILLAPKAGANCMESSIRSAFNWDSMGFQDRTQLKDVAAFFGDVYDSFDQFESRYRGIAYDILDAHGGTWEALAYALLRKHTLDETELCEVAGDLATGWKSVEPPSHKSMAGPISRPAPTPSAGKITPEFIQQMRQKRPLFKSSEGSVEAGGTVFGVGYR